MISSSNLTLSRTHHAIDTTVHAQNDITAIHQEFMVQMRTYDLFYCLQVSPSNSSEPNLTILYSIMETGRNFVNASRKTIDLLIYKTQTLVL